MGYRAGGRRRNTTAPRRGCREHGVVSGRLHDADLSLAASQSSQRRVHRTRNRMSEGIRLSNAPRARSSWCRVGASVRLHEVLLRSSCGRGVAPSSHRGVERPSEGISGARGRTGAIIHSCIAENETRGVVPTCVRQDRPRKQVGIRVNEVSCATSRTSTACSAPSARQPLSSPGLFVARIEREPPLVSACPMAGDDQNMRPPVESSQVSPNAPRLVLYMVSTACELAFKQGGTATRCRRTATRG